MNGRWWRQRGTISWLVKPLDLMSQNDFLWSEGVYRASLYHTRAAALQLFLSWFIKACAGVRRRLISTRARVMLIAAQNWRSACFEVFGSWGSERDEGFGVFSLLHECVCRSTVPKGIWENSKTLRRRACDRWQMDQSVCGEKELNDSQNSSDFSTIMSLCWRRAHVSFTQTTLYTINH